MVVTIVVLLILAGVSINLVLSNSGIISRSNEAKKEYAEAKANEESDLESAVDWIDEQATGQVSLAKVPVGTKSNKNGTINGEEGSSNNPVIPKGYIPIDTETSSWGDGSSAPTQESVDHGLVIKDESGNEWVWVPVENEVLRKMCKTENTDEYTLCGTSVTTKLYSQPGIISGYTRTNPGDTSDYREPDLVTTYDTNEYYQTRLGYDSTEEMAKAFVGDYEEMIKSVKTYGGFYIGRYELSAEGVKKDRAPIRGSDWYDLYKKCKELNASEKVETRMIWGCQWDVTMNWLVTSGAKTSDEVFTDSSTWGNYYSTSVKADDGETEIKASGTGTKLNTGVTTFTRANNIYDLAGNCWEWTQEANDRDYRAYRGGSSYYREDSCDSASYRGEFPTFGGDGGDYCERISPHFNNKVALSARA